MIKTYILILLISILPITIIFADNTGDKNQGELSDEDILDMFEDDDDESPENDILEKIDDPELDIEITEIEYKIHKAISVEWIESMLLFRQGMKLKLKELNALIEETKFRLKQLNHFYTIKILAKPSFKNIHERRIIVEVSEGFWYGFSFYPVNITFVFRHLFNAGKKLGLTGGVTEQAAWFYDPSVLNSSFFYTIFVSHKTNMEIAQKYIEDSTLISFTPGMNLIYGISLNAVLEWQTLSFPKEYFYFNDFSYNLSEEEVQLLGLDTTASYLKFGFENKYDFNRTEYGSILGMENIIQGKYILDINDNNLSFWAFQNRLKLFFRPVFPLYFVARGLAGYHTKKAYPYLQYHLYDFDYFRGIPKVDYGDHILTGNFDISLIDLLTVQLGMFNIDFQPFLYCDFGRLFQYEEALNFDNFEIAAGGGIHVYFAYPVGMYLTLGVRSRVDPEEMKFDILFNVTDFIY